MKKLSTYLINLVLTASIYAAPVIDLEKSIFELTREELGQIKAIIQEVPSEAFKKEFMATIDRLYAVNPQIRAPKKIPMAGSNSNCTVPDLFLNILTEIKSERPELPHDIEYTQLIGKTGSCPEPLPLDNKENKEIIIQHYNKEAQIVKKIAQLLIENPNKSGILVSKKRNFNVIYINNEDLFFRNEPLLSSRIIQTIALTKDEQNKNYLMSKYYVAHPNNTVESDHNSLLFNKKTSFVKQGDKTANTTEVPSYHLCSAQENIPAGMFPHSLKTLSSIDLPRSINDFIEEITQKEYLFTPEEIDFFIKFLLSDNKTISRESIIKHLSQNRNASELAETELALKSIFQKIPELRKLTQQCKADQDRYAFVTSLFEPLIEEKPEAQYIIITLPNLHNPLERNTLLLSYLFSEIKQLQQMAPEAPEAQVMIEQQIEKLQAAAKEQTQAIESCLREEEEQKVRSKIKERSAPKEKTKPAKKPKKKDLIIASNTKPSEILEEEKQLEKMKAVIDNIVEKKLKTIVEDCHNKPNAIVRKLGEFCEHFGIAMGLSSGKGSHAKLQFGDDVGSVVVPMHEELKQGTAGAVVNQLTLAITKRIGLQNATLDALKNVATTLRLETTPSK